MIYDIWYLTFTNGNGGGVMKKLIGAFLVLAMASVAWAGTVWFEIDPADIKDSYNPSDVIRINLVADFDVCTVGIGEIASNGGSVPNIIGFNPKFTPVGPPGIPINNGGTLIEYIAGSVAMGQPGAPAGEWLYAFEFHVPDVPASTMITIDDVTDYTAAPPKYTSINSPDWTVMVSDVVPLTIHEIPEPMTIALLGLGGLFLHRRK
jgi:hypothetical protein